jgi:hypothetical protein
MVPDAPLEYVDVHRHLSDPIYRIRFWGIRLMDADLFLLLLAAWGSWSLFVAIGIDKYWVLSPALTLDPIGWLSILVASAIFISILHKYRPEGSIEEIIKSMGNPSLFSLAIEGKDKRYRPGSGRWVDIPGTN